MAHRTVRCARPGHTSVVFCSLYLNPFLVFLLVCCEPLAPVDEDNNNYKKHIKTESSFLNYDLGTLNFSSSYNNSSNSINLSFENESFVDEDENILIKQNSVELIDFIQQNINDISKQLNSFYYNKDSCDIDNIEEFDSSEKINLIKNFKIKRSKLIDNPSLIKSIIKILFNASFLSEKDKNQKTNKIKKN